MGSDLYELVNEWRSGSLDAFETVYSMVNPMLEHYSRNSMRGWECEDREDVLQKTWLKAWCSIDGYDRSKSSFQTWMVRIMDHTAIDEYRKYRSKGYALLDPIEDTQYIPAGIDTEKECDRHMVSKLIEAASQRLPDLDRVIFELSVKGYTHAEISDIVGVTEAGVKSRMYRSRCFLRTELSSKLQG